jgi:hypothetical protein
MNSTASSLLPPDGRQSATARAVARGTTRLLHALGFCVVSELSLPSGRRADLAALGGTGEIWIVEIKSSVADFAPTRNGWTTGCTATGCSSPPRSRSRATSSRPTPA